MSEEHLPKEKVWTCSWLSLLVLAACKTAKLKLHGSRTKISIKRYKTISVTTCDGILLEPCPSTAHQNDYRNWVVVKKITRGKESNMKNWHRQTEVLSLPAKQENFYKKSRNGWSPLNKTVMTLGGIYPYKTPLLPIRTVVHGFKISNSPTTHWWQVVAS